MKKTPNVVAVLGALRSLDAPHGLAIAYHTGLKPPTVYRVLYRLRTEGWVTARQDGRRVRYELTQLGASWADAWTLPVGEVVASYRRRAEYVRAIRWTGNNWDAVSAFVGDNVQRDGDVLWLRTVDDNVESCRIGWWIVEGVHNKYPVPPDVFSATYEVQ